ncbi:MAG: hypothetical protein ACYDAG_13525 [Chloroflexota bacterium]
METARVWQMLGSGGLSIHDDEGQSQTLAALPKYNGLADPAGAEELGKLLAQRARDLAPSLVLLWEDPQDLVLGHVVARELGVPALRSYDQEGLVGLAGALPAGARVLIVGDAFRDKGVVAALRNVIEAHAGSVAGAAVLVETEALTSATGGTLRVVSLVRDDRPREESGNGRR